MDWGSFEIGSSSGREAVRWEVIDRRPSRRDTVLICDVHLAGRYLGAALGDDARVSERQDYGLALRGLALRVADLERLHAYLGSWLCLDPGE